MKIVQRLAVLSACGLVLFAGGAGVQRWRQTQRSESLPTAPARKGEFLAVVRCRGELKARRNVQVTAPINVPELRLVWLAEQGGKIKAGDPIVKFDPSSARQQLQEKEAALQQAQASLDQAVAQGRISGEQSKLDLSSAQYVVEKAKLEASKAEIVSRLQGEESRVDLGLAEKKLSVQEANGKLEEASQQAKIASLTRARDKARDERDLTQHRIAQMEVRAPASGIIHFLPNYSQGWMNAKPFKVGDQVWPGGVMAEIPDLNSLELEGKIEEIDRGQLNAGQEARVRIDSLPENTFPANLAQLSPMTEMTWDWPPSRTFRGFAKLLQADSRLQPGMAGSVDVVIKKIPNAISVPAKSLFTRNGKAIVYLADHGQFRAVDVNVLARNPDEIAIEGIAGGSSVSLVEPVKASGKKAKT